MALKNLHHTARRISQLMGCLAMASTLLLSGCGRNADTCKLGQFAAPHPERPQSYADKFHQDWPPEDPELPPFTGKVEVITDTAELARIRKTYAGNHPRHLIDDLKRLDPKAIAETKARLQSGNRELQAMAFEDLARHHQIPVAVYDSAFVALIYGMLDTTTHKRELLNLLTIADTVHVATYVQDLLCKGILTEDEYGVAIYGLTTGPLQNSAIYMLQTLLFQQEGAKGKEEDYQAMREILFTLTGALPKGNTFQRRWIEGILMAYARQDRLNWFDQVALMESFAGLPSPNMLAFFEEVDTDEKILHNTAMVGIAKLRGAEARGEIASSFNDSAVYYGPVEAIPFAWKDEPIAAMEILERAYALTPVKSEHEKILYLADLMGGLELVTALITDIPPSLGKDYLQSVYDILYAEPITASHPWIRFSDSMVTAGMRTTPLTVQEVDSIRKENRRFAQTWIESSLQYDSPNFVQVEAMTNELPKPYDDMIRKEFVAMAGGRLDDLEVYIDFKKPEPFDAQETVYLIYKNRGYVFQPRWAMFYFDVDAVAQALNLLLADAGFEERLYCVDPIGQDRQYLFLPPSKVPLALQLFDLQPSDHENVLVLEN